jgi:hypothetical protein
MSCFAARLPPARYHTLKQNGKGLFYGVLSVLFYLWIPIPNDGSTPGS